MSNDNIPKDPAILLSYINTKLRDFYPSLEELCTELSIDRNEIEKALSEIDYHYDTSKNRFM